MKITIEEVIVQEFDVDIDCDITTPEGVSKVVEEVSSMYYNCDLVVDNGECEEVRVRLDDAPDAPWIEL